MIKKSFPMVILCVESDPLRIQLLPDLFRVWGEDRPQFTDGFMWQHSLVRLWNYLTMWVERMAAMGEFIVLADFLNDMHKKELTGDFLDACKCVQGHLLHHLLTNIQLPLFPHVGCNPGRIVGVFYVGGT
jgi:hypothetical protein